jgi:ribonuclease J
MVTRRSGSAGLLTLNFNMADQKLQIILWGSRIRHELHGPRYGDDIIVIDAGMMFPGCGAARWTSSLPISRTGAECRARPGLVLTHGHEDHIGAVPFRFRS